MELQKGDYVLATEFHDGDPKHQFAVGFFLRTKGYRYLVINKDGLLFRPYGFRRCEKISRRVGRILYTHMKAIKACDRSVWYWRRNVKSLEKLHVDPKTIIYTGAS